MIKSIFFILLFSITNIYADNTKLTALQTVVKMKQAMSTMNYQATLIFSKNGKTEPMLYSHAVNKDMEQEYLVSLNSPLREIIRNRNELIFLFKETQEVVINHRNYKHSFLADLPKNINDLTSIYEFRFSEPEYVALMPVFVVDIQPKDKFRFPRKLWINKENFLPLKLVVYDFSNKPLEEIFATELHVKDSIPFKTVADLLLKHKQILPDPVNVAASFEVKNPPPGFKLVFSTRSHLHNDNRVVEDLLLSDGFSKVSVYIENMNAAPGSANIASPQSMGTINSYTITKNNLQITAMGEVPMLTVKLIAECVVPKGSPRSL